MSVKIIGGALKGSKLSVTDKITKPTGVLLRRRIFDSRQNLSGFCFIDLCAGSGAVGLEAISRGAQEAFFIELNRHAFKNLHQNINILSSKFPIYFKHINLDIICDSAEKWLPIGFSSFGQQSSTIIFLDPPYDNRSLYFKIINWLIDNNFNGELWVEYDLKGDPELQGFLKKNYDKYGVKKYTHGQHQICILRFFQT